MSPPQHPLVTDRSDVAESLKDWSQHRHHRRKRRRFSRRKVKKVVKLSLIITLHIIAIALLIYIWVKFAYSPGFNG